ncbi:MAG: hypothetical protein J5697_01960 [Clostridia bacterium]|nr:hypothetical protein [Clostridia bacterium]
MNEYNKKAINDTYKNAHVALQSIKDLLPAVKDAKLKKELKDEYDGYSENIREIAEFMEKNRLKPKDINVFKKATMWTAIKMKTMINGGKNHIAEMMIKGTVMGITELTAMKNESDRLTEGVKQRIDKLLELEESYEERLKKFL